MSDGDAPTTADVTRYRVTIDMRELMVDVTESAAGLSVRVGDSRPRPVAVRRVRGDAMHSFVVGGGSFAALVDGHDGEYTVVLDGRPVDVVVEDERTARLRMAAGVGQRAAGETTVAAPMPGLVVAVHVEAGQAVAKGASLIVLQAMKMENDLTARADGIVKDVLVSPGQTVDQGQVLLTLE